MDMSEFFQEIMDIHDNWVAIVGCIDIVYFNKIFKCKSEYSSADVNPLANKLCNEDFYIIIGKGTHDMIIDALFTKSKHF